LDKTVINANLIRRGNRLWIY